MGLDIYPPNVTRGILPFFLSFCGTVPGVSLLRLHMLGSVLAVIKLFKLPATGGLIFLLMG
jgi:hypothetical protein